MFTEHFLMSEEDAIRYAREKLDIFTPQDELACKEIGDGNVNYVFRVFSRNSSHSIIIKQADYSTRLASSQLSIERNRIEADILKIEKDFADEMVPEVYLYDPVMSCVVMEDLTGYEIMRYALIDEKIFPGFAEKISTFMAKTLANTTDFILDPKEKKELVRQFINPDMCDISERLVYSDPYIKPVYRGDVADDNLDYVNQDLQMDVKLKSEVAKLKLDFMRNAQALIHGDLHTGSIFIKPDSVMVIDPEFAFFGPIGYDVGNVIANLIFAWVRAMVFTDKDTEAHALFLDWIKETLEDTIDLFKTKFLNILAENSHDLLFRSTDLQAWYLDTILADTAGVAGLEINRRIIGVAKVKDVVSLDASGFRARAERILMESARQFIMNRSDYKTGSDFTSTVEHFTKLINK
jgi:5-methylthioribose kinase